MDLKRAVGAVVRRRRLLAAPVAALALAAPAAAQAEDYSVYIGGPGTDVFNEHGQPGNFRLWGLGGFTAEAGGRGDNWMWGTGNCPGPKHDTMGYDNATEEWDAYCSPGEDGGPTGAVLIGGGGVNHIMGSGGPNVIVSGPDDPRSGTGNYIYGGPAGDVIAAIQGSSTIYPGAGRNLIDARGQDVDSIYCVKGDKNTTVYAEPYDAVVRCAHVIYGAPPRSATPATNPALTPTTVTQATAILNAVPSNIRTRAGHRRHSSKKHHGHKTHRRSH